MQTQTQRGLVMANQKKATPKLDSKVQQKLDQLTTWSAKFRYLSKEGFTTGDISRITGKRFQHVRNVLITPLSNS